MSQMKDFSGKTNSFASDAFGEERKLLAKSLKMGTAWSYYKEKRKEKKKLKRCVDFRLSKSIILLGFIRKNNSHFLGAIKLKLNQTAKDNDFQSCSYAGVRAQWN